MVSHFFHLLAAFTLFACFAPANAALQTPEDQADPSVVVKEATRPGPPQQAPRRPSSIEPNAAPAVAVEKAVLVGAIRVDGAQIVPQSAFAPVIAPFLGRELGPQDLSQLASAVADVARNQGYALATAWIPQQRLENGILHVVIDEGRIDEIHVDGPAAAAVEARLRPLVNGRPVKTSQLERRLLVAEDIAGVWVGKVRLERRAGRNILLANSSYDRVQAHIYADNWGSATVGPFRVRAAVDINGVLSDDDRFSIGGISTPFQPSEFVLASAAYYKPIGTSGTEFSVDGYYARSDAGSVLSDRTIIGHSGFAEMGLSHALTRSRALSAWGYLQFAWLDSNETEHGAKFRDDRTRTLSLSSFAVATSENTRVRGWLGFKQGLQILGATEENDPFPSRPDASGVFSKLGFWAAYDRKLGGTFSLGLQAQGQVASRPLLSSEEIGLGGRYFLRGYDYREYSGDKGIAGSAELRFDLKNSPAPLSSAQLYVYGDAGTVGNYRGGYGSGSLASAGGGVRVTLSRKFDAGLELGVPLKHGAIPNKHYGPRASFTLAAHF